MRKDKNSTSGDGIMAIAIIAILPILLVYPFIQKELVKGMVVGGVKG